MSGETSLLQAEVDSIHVWQREWPGHRCAIPGNWVQPANIYGTYVPGYSYYLAENCENAGGGLYLTPSCSDGSPVVVSGGTFECGGKELSVTSTPPYIPGGTSVDKNGHVLTVDLLHLLVTESGQPLAGLLVPLKSDRGPLDDINVLGPTGSEGKVNAFVSTHNQSGASTITSASPDIDTAQPGMIQWLPAHYESLFLVTCYVVSLESDFLDSKLVTAKGIPDHEYHSGFLTDTKLQGTGLALDGSYIHYQGNGYYAPITCPQTRSGACAVDGESAAVDRHIIPALAHFTVDGIGDRAAQDTGGGINGYHIDIFYGTRRHDCLQWGKRRRGVDLLGYGE